MASGATTGTNKSDWIASCPKLVLDWHAEVIAHLNKLAHSLEFGANGRIELLHDEIKSCPCLLHAPGPSKYAVPSLSWWVDGNYSNASSQAFAQGYLSRLEARAFFEARHFFEVTVLPQVQKRLAGQSCNRTLASPRGRSTRHHLCP
eukprot:817275-Prymnesium_polylepis.1